MFKFSSRIVVLYLCLLCAVLPFAAQETPKQCGLQNSPSLENLRLGMSPEQTQNVLGKNLKIKIKKNGQRTFFQNFIKNRPPQTLNGVRALYLRFFDRKLYQIEIFYEKRNDARSLEDFIASLSANWNLPVSVWQIENGKAAINCGEFSIAADNVLNPRVEITDAAVFAKVEELREK